MTTTTKSDTPTSLHESINKLRRDEFKALYKIINDMRVELRLLAALSENDGSFKIDAQKVMEVINRYEEEAIGLLRITANRLRSI